MNGTTFADRFVILFSHERSGSHYLTDMLVRTGFIHSLDEVCNYKAIDPDKSKASFFRFRFNAQASDPDILLRPSPESISRLLSGYLTELSNLIPPQKKILIDIKYGHVHNFEVGWWPTERRPFLFLWLEKEQIPIVHLLRRDSLSAAVSNLIAEKTDVWHLKGDRENEQPSIRIPVQRAVHEALLLDQEKQNSARWLAGAVSHCIEYEQIADDIECRHAAMTRLCEFLRIATPTEFSSRHRKVTPPLAEALSNYEDLIKCARLFGWGRIRVN